MTYTFGKPLKAPNELLPFDHRLFEYERGIVMSPKFDGNRCLVICGELHTSSMKTPRNERLPEFMSLLINLSRKTSMVFDCELFDPEGQYHAQLSGDLNSYSNLLPPQLGCYVFDAITMTHWYDQSVHVPYRARIENYHEWIKLLRNPRFVAVPQEQVSCSEEADAFYRAQLAAGHEGAIMRYLDVWQEGKRWRGGRYKHGRATLVEKNIYKCKAFETLDGFIVDVQQRRKMKDGWPREYDARGNLIRPTTQDAYELDDSVGAFVVRVHRFNGWTGELTHHFTEVGFGKGFPLDMRRRWWLEYVLDPAVLIGRGVEIEHMPHGAKTKAEESGRLRIGRLKRFRADCNYPFNDALQLGAQFKETARD